MNKEKTAIITSCTLLTLVGLTGCFENVAKKFSDKASSNSINAGPQPPTLTTPLVSPYYSSNLLLVNGKCAEGTTVYLADATSTFTSPCSSNAFSLTGSKSTDGTYSFIVYQVDSNRRSSVSRNIRWIRDSHVPTMPTVVSPDTNVFYSSNTITISGACTDEHTVILSGGDNQSVECNSSQFSFFISKPLDGVYDFSINQTSKAGVASPTVTQKWVRDSSSPSVSFISTPSSLNISSTSASFSFNSSVTSSFACSIDGGTFSPCGSCSTGTTCSTIYPGLTNTAHSFTFQATSMTGRTTTSSTYSWTQAVFDTIALYHLNASPGFSTDSGGYGSTVYSNNLSNFGTTQATSAKFSEGRIFSAAASQYMSVADNPTHALLAQTMTIDGFVKLTSKPGVTNFVIASKNGGAGQLGWEFGIRNAGGSSQNLYFSASPDGSSSPVVITSSNINFGTSTFRYVGVTVNSGAVTFFYNASAKGTGNLGFSTLNNPGVPLQIGASNSSLFLNGTLDEIRLSKAIRTFSVVPTSPFIPD